MFRCWPKPVTVLIHHGKHRFKRCVSAALFSTPPDFRMHEVKPCRSVEPAEEDAAGDVVL